MSIHFRAVPDCDSCSVDYDSKKSQCTNSEDALNDAIRRALDTSCAGRTIAWRTCVTQCTVARNCAAGGDTPAIVYGRVAHIVLAALDEREFAIEQIERRSAINTASAIKVRLDHLRYAVAVTYQRTTVKQRRGTRTACVVGLVRKEVLAACLALANADIGHLTRKAWLNFLRGALVARWTNAALDLGGTSTGGSTAGCRVDVVAHKALTASLAIGLATNLLVFATGAKLAHGKV